MYTHIYIHAQTCIYFSQSEEGHSLHTFIIHTYIHAYMIYIYTSARETCIHACMDTYILTKTYIYNLREPCKAKRGTTCGRHTHTYTHTYTYTSTHIHTHTSQGALQGERRDQLWETYIHTYTHTQAHTHTYTHISGSRARRREGPIVGFSEANTGCHGGC